MALSARDIATPERPLSICQSVRGQEATTSQWQGEADAGNPIEAALQQQPREACATIQAGIAAQ
ncbi:hypothetical protein [Bradyrhizobium sp. UFLA05-112]